MINEQKIQETIENFKVFSDGETTKLLLEYLKLKNQTQNYKKDNVLYVVVGPSGSGKSTFIANMYYNNVFGNSIDGYVPFINRAYYNKSVPEKDRVYLQDEIALKKKLCTEGRSFLMEIAEYNDDYFHFIKDIKENKNGEYANYQICMIYLTKRSPKDNVKCVQTRKLQGGHGKTTRELNVNYVAEQYVTDGINLKRSIPFCDSVFVVNNKTQRHSKIEKPAIIMQKKLSGEIVLSPLQHYQEQYQQIINPTIKQVMQTPISGLLRRFKVKKASKGVVLHESPKVKSVETEQYVIIDDQLINAETGKPLNAVTLHKK